MSKTITAIIAGVVQHTKIKLVCLVILVFAGACEPSTTRIYDTHLEYLREPVEQARELAQTLPNTWPLSSIAIRTGDTPGYTAWTVMSLDGSGLVTIDNTYLETSDEAAVVRTVLHEIAHLLTFSPNSGPGQHGQTWCDTYLALVAAITDDMRPAIDRVQEENPDCVLPA